MEEIDLRNFIKLVFSSAEYMQEIALENENNIDGIFSSLTIRQHEVIRSVDKLTIEKPTGVSLKELAENMNMSAAFTSELVESLVKKNVLKRTPCVEDRRAVRIVLAEKTKNIIEDAKSTLLKIFSEIMVNLPQDNINITYETLKEINVNLLKNKGKKNDK